MAVQMVLKEVGRKRLRLVTGIRHLTADVIMIFDRRSGGTSELPAMS